MLCTDKILWSSHRLQQGRTWRPRMQLWQMLLLSLLTANAGQVENTTVSPTSSAKLSKSRPADPTQIIIYVLLRWNKEISTELFSVLTIQSRYRLKLRKEIAVWQRSRRLLYAEQTKPTHMRSNVIDECQHTCIEIKIAKYIRNIEGSCGISNRSRAVLNSTEDSRVWSPDQ